MKVIPPAMVSSKLFSVSANTVPFWGGKSHNANTSRREGQGHVLGLQKYEPILFLNAVMHAPRSHKNTCTICISLATQKGRAVASKGQRFIRSLGPWAQEMLWEVADTAQCSAPRQSRVGSGAATVLQGSAVWTSQLWADRAWICTS